MSEQEAGVEVYRHSNRTVTYQGKECDDDRCGCHEFVKRREIGSFRERFGKNAVLGVDYAKEGERDRTVAVDLGFDPATSVAFDRVEPSGPWKFDQEVTDAFEDMLRRSIPQYDVMRAAVNSLGARFVKDGTDVFDLGCARGEALEPFLRKFGARNRFVGIDASEPMIEAATRRFEGYIRAGVVRIERMDLRTEFPAGRPSLILLVLTLQFVPLEARQSVLWTCYERLVPGGALLLVEKLGIGDYPLGQAFEETYRDHKRAAGYTDEQIERKRLSLEGVLVPLREEENLGRLRTVGFGQAECFWRWMQFAGFVAVKR